MLLELWNDDIRAELAVTERDAAAARARREEACVAAQGRAPRIEPAREPGGAQAGVGRARRARRGRSRGARGGVPRGRRADPREPGAHRGRPRAARAHAAARAVRRHGGRDQRRDRRVRHALAGRHPDAAGGGRRRHQLHLHHRADRRGGRAARAARACRRGSRSTRSATAASRPTCAAWRPTCSTPRSRRAPSRSRPRSTTRGDALLLPGYSADVEVILAERADVLRIPTRALLEGKRVYVLEDGRVRAREVHDRHRQLGVHGDHRRARGRRARDRLDRPRRPRRRRARPWRADAGARP